MDPPQALAEPPAPPPLPEPPALDSINYATRLYDALIGKVVPAENKTRFLDDQKGPLDRAEKHFETAKRTLDRAKKKFEKAQNTCWKSYSSVLEARAADDAIVAAEAIGWFTADKRKHRIEARRNSMTALLDQASHDMGTPMKHSFLPADTKNGLRRLIHRLQAEPAQPEQLPEDGQAPVLPPLHAAPVAAASALPARAPQSQPAPAILTTTAVLQQLAQHSQQLQQVPRTGLVPSRLPFPRNRQTHAHASLHSPSAPQQVDQRKTAMNSSMRLAGAEIENGNGTDHKHSGDGGYGDGVGQGTRKQQRGNDMVPAGSLASAQIAKPRRTANASDPPLRAPVKQQERFNSKPSANDIIDLTVNELDESSRARLDALLPYSTLSTSRNTHAHQRQSLVQKDTRGRVGNEDKLSIEAPLKMELVDEVCELLRAQRLVVPARPAAHRALSLSTINALEALLTDVRAKYATARGLIDQTMARAIEVSYQKRTFDGLSDLPIPESVRHATMDAYQVHADFLLVLAKALCPESERKEFEQLLAAEDAELKASAELSGRGTEGVSTGIQVKATSPLGSGASADTRVSHRVPLASASVSMPARAQSPSQAAGHGSPKLNPHTPPKLTKYDESGAEIESEEDVKFDPEPPSLHLCVDVDDALDSHHTLDLVLELTPDRDLPTGVRAEPIESETPAVDLDDLPRGATATLAARAPGGISETTDGRADRNSEIDQKDSHDPFSYSIDKATLMFNANDSIALDPAAQRLVAKQKTSEPTEEIGKGVQKPTQQTPPGAQLGFVEQRQQQPAALAAQTLPNPVPQLHKKKKRKTPNVAHAPDGSKPSRPSIVVSAISSSTQKPVDASMPPDRAVVSELDLPVVAQSLSQSLPSTTSVTDRAAAGVAQPDHQREPNSPTPQRDPLARVIQQEADDAKASGLAPPTPAPQLQTEREQHPPPISGDASASFQPRLSADRKDSTGSQQRFFSSLPSSPTQEHEKTGPEHVPKPSPNTSAASAPRPLTPLPIAHPPADLSQSMSVARPAEQEPDAQAIHATDVSAAETAQTEPDARAMDLTESEKERQQQPMDTGTDGQEEKDREKEKRAEKRAGSIELVRAEMHRRHQQLLRQPPTPAHTGRVTQPQPAQSALAAPAHGHTPPHDQPQSPTQPSEHVEHASFERGVDCPMCYERLDTKEYSELDCAKRCRWHTACYTRWLDGKRSMPKCEVCQVAVSEMTSIPSGKITSLWNWGIENVLDIKWSNEHGWLLKIHWEEKTEVPSTVLEGWHTELSLAHDPKHRNLIAHLKRIRSCRKRFLCKICTEISSKRAYIDEKSFHEHYTTTHRKSGFSEHLLRIDINEAINAPLSIDRLPSVIAAPGPFSAARLPGTPAYSRAQRHNRRERGEPASVGEIRDANADSDEDDRDYEDDDEKDESGSNGSGGSDSEAAESDGEDSEQTVNVGSREEKEPPGTDKRNKHKFERTDGHTGKQKTKLVPCRKRKGEKTSNGKRPNKCGESKKKNNHDPAPIDEERLEQHKASRSTYYAPKSLNPGDVCHIKAWLRQRARPLPFFSDRQFRVLVLFQGTGSVEKALCDYFGVANVEIVSLDIDPAANATHTGDIFKFHYQQYPPGYFDMVWASPMCKMFSLLQTCYRKDKTSAQFKKDLEEAKDMVKLSRRIIDYFRPHFWIIENPETGTLKNMDFMQDLEYANASYCRYGFLYQKDTRFWTNKADVLRQVLVKCNNRCNARFLGHLGRYRHVLRIGTSDKRRRPPGGRELLGAVPRALILAMLNAVFRVPRLADSPAKSDADDDEKRDDTMEDSEDPDGSTRSERSTGRHGDRNGSASDGEDHTANEMDGAGEQRRAGGSTTVISTIKESGGKSKVAQALFDLLPTGAKRVDSPFVGGASFELLCVRNGINVRASDIDRLLINYWQETQRDRKAVAEMVRQLTDGKVDGKSSKEAALQVLEQAREGLAQANLLTTQGRLRAAAEFYIDKQLSFGRRTDRVRPFLKQGSHHWASNLQHLETVELPTALIRFHVLDYVDAIRSRRKGSLLFLDPPYAEERASAGHNDIDHLALFNLLHHEKRWLLTLRRGSAAHALYKDFAQLPLQSRGFGGSRSQEVVIFSPDIRPRRAASQLETQASEPESAHDSDSDSGQDTKDGTGERILFWNCAA